MSTLTVFGQSRKDCVDKFWEVHNHYYLRQSDHLVVLDTEGYRLIDTSTKQLSSKAYPQVYFGGYNHYVAHVDEGYMLLDSTFEPIMPTLFDSIITHPQSYIPNDESHPDLFEAIIDSERVILDTRSKSYYKSEKRIVSLARKEARLIAPWMLESDPFDRLRPLMTTHPKYDSLNNGSYEFGKFPNGYSIRANLTEDGRFVTVRKPSGDVLLSDTGFIRLVEGYGDQYWACSWGNTQKIYDRNGYLILKINSSIEPRILEHKAVELPGLENSFGRIPEDTVVGIEAFTYHRISRLGRFVVARYEDPYGPCDLILNDELVFSNIEIQLIVQSHDYLLFSQGDCSYFYDYTTGEEINRLSGCITDPFNAYATGFLKLTNKDLHGLYSLNNQCVVVEPKYLALLYDGNNEIFIGLRQDCKVVYILPNGTELSKRGIGN